MAVGARSTTVEVRLLGGVDVLVAEARVPLGGAKPRAVFAMLALQPDTVVSVERLVDGVWGETAPQSVRSSLQVHVSNMRRSLTTAGAGDLVATRPGGYTFVSGSAVVDVHRFGDLAKNTRQAFEAGDLVAAHDNARSARTLWRGAPLAGIGEAPYAAAMTTSLDLQWLELVELAADVEIARGCAADVVADLERVVTDNPYRETSWLRLALALYLSGRQADALNRLTTLRRILSEDLGLDPSPDIAALELAVLNQDPSLSAGKRSLVVPTIKSHLPPIRPLIGRGRLIADVTEELEVDRLVTLVGPGGIGKTSVAISCAAQITAEPGSIGVFVDLASIDTPAAMLPSILADLGVRTFDPEVAESSLVALLNEEARPLLIMDNCEHLIDHVAPLIQTLIDHCPRLRVLATSREPLGTPSETIRVCEPLTADDATELFLSRAQSVDRNYAASEEERSAIHEMAIRLDGLPLGMELFASRVRSLTATEMLKGFDDAALLTTSLRGTTARHRSLHDAVEWSYQLLDENEQRCLRRMSVFGGSASLAAVIAVCGLTGPSALESLVGRSLVVAERTGAGARYRLSVPVRAFAAAQLAESGERAEVQRRLVSHTIEWARGLRDALEGPDPALALTELASNAANVRIAHEVAGTQIDANTAASLVAAFGPHGLTFSGALPESEGWVREGLKVKDADPRDRLVLLLVAAYTFLEDQPILDAFTDEALAIAAELDDRDAIVLATAHAASSRLMNDVEMSLEMAKNALEMSDHATHPLSVAVALGIASTAAVRTRRAAEARSLIDHACALGTRRFGGSEAHVLFLDGRISMLNGDLDRAAETFRAAQDAGRRTLSVQGQAVALFGRAEVDLRLGNAAAALLGYRQSLAATLVGNRHEATSDRMMVARAACAVGDLQLAEDQVNALGEPDATMFSEAPYHTAAGYLARARGHNDVAADHLIRAIRLWGHGQVWDVVSDLLEALASCVDGADEQRRLVDAANGIRAGTVSVADAIELIDSQ